MSSYTDASVKDLSVCIHLRNVYYKTTMHCIWRHICRRFRSGWDKHRGAIKTGLKCKD